MIALRLLSLLAGAVVLILPSVLLANASAGMPGTTVAAALLGVALVSASFIYVALAGDRMRRSAGARMLGALLLAVPIVGSLVLMASRKDPMLLWGSGALLAFSLVLFLSFVFPAAERRQRPMRQRERLV
jgi:hypothetical protein